LISALNKNNVSCKFRTTPVGKSSSQLEITTKTPGQISYANSTSPPNLQSIPDDSPHNIEETITYQGKGIIATLLNESPHTVCLPQSQYSV